MYKFRLDIKSYELYWFRKLNVIIGKYAIIFGTNLFNRDILH